MVTKKQNAKMLAKIEGVSEERMKSIETLADIDREYLKNDILKIKEINDSMGQIFQVKHSYGHIPFYTREEAELFVSLIKGDGK